MKIISCAKRPVTRYCDHYAVGQTITRKFGQMDAVTSTISAIESNGRDCWAMSTGIGRMLGAQTDFAFSGVTELVAQTNILTKYSAVFRFGDVTTRQPRVDISLTKLPSDHPSVTVDAQLRPFVIRCSVQENYDPPPVSAEVEICCPGVFRDSVISSIRAVLRDPLSESPYIGGYMIGPIDLTHGDCGSMVKCKDSDEAIGIVYAAYSQNEHNYALVCPFLLARNVLNELGFMPH